MTKIYKVQMNSKGMPNFSTAVEVADRPKGWIDKAIHTLYEMLKTGNFMCVVPYGDKGRYATYYAEDRLYLVFDLWYHGLFLVEAKSPRDAIDQVNCDRLAYVPKEEGADDD